MGQAGGARVKRYLVGVATSALTACWSWLLPDGPNVPRRTAAPSDNLQGTMNLVMPLRSPTLITRAELVQILFKGSDQILAGLNNVGTVHFARFDVVDGNLCMFSVYDGELSAYIRDFIATIGSAFDALLGCVKDPPPTPTALHVDEFVEWVRRRDAFQMPEYPTDLTRRDLVSLPREALVTLHRNPNIQLGFYRAYPGFSAAQIRDRLSLGW